MKNPFKKYAEDFSENSFWAKIKGYARQAGLKTAYSGLLLYYAYRRHDTPSWAKKLILGVLGYFISPLDALPDLTPLIGYTDDLGVLTFGLVTIACYINDEVKGNARQQLNKWFGEYDEQELAEVDKQL
ncbi:MAG: uncharacterized membrane protein YkvA (DUF1232 family) [Saprospiraceae bacterium]|jgi:uncharacterized membrane protein YkvA (DUF1232 family)